MIIVRALAGNNAYAQLICQILCQFAKTCGVFIQFPATLVMMIVHLTP